MKYLLLLTSLAGLTGIHGQPTTPAAPIAIAGVTIVNVASPTTEEALLPDHTVVVSGSRISAMGPTRFVAVPPDAQRVDGRGKYLIPGLWDMHAHLLNTEERLEYFPALFIANGVTQIREIGNALDPARVRDVRRSLEQGTKSGPTMAALTLQILEGVGGRVGSPFLLVPDDAAAARRAVQTHKAQGADFIKVYNRLSRDAYLAIIGEARRAGLPVAGHVPASMSATEVSDLGQRSIEHSGSAGSTPAELMMSCSTDEAALRKRWQELNAYNGPPQGLRAYVDRIYRSTEERAAATYDESKAATLLKTFVRNNTWHVPTLVVDAPTVVEQSTLMTSPRLKYMRPSAVDRWQTEQANLMKISGDVAVWRSRVARRLRLIGDMHRAGVPLLAGTDANLPFVVPGFSLHDELALLVKAGLTPLEALRTATVNPARFLGQSESIGLIEPGKIADLLLLEANPLQEITNTQAIDGVIAYGHFLPRAALDDLLSKVELMVRRDVP